MKTRDSRHVEVTNAGLETRVKVRTQEEHRREREFRVVLSQEREGRVKELLGRGDEIRV